MPPSALTVRCAALRSTCIAAFPAFYPPLNAIKQARVPPAEAHAVHLDGSAYACSTTRMQQSKIPGSAGYEFRKRIRLSRGGVGGSEKRGHFGAFGAGWSAAFQNEPFSLIRRCSSERPGAVKGAPLLGAAKRTLDR